MVVAFEAEKCDGLRPHGGSGSESEGGPRTLAAMDRAAVHDPEDPARGAIRLLGHDLGNQAVEDRDGDLIHHGAEQASSMHVPSSHVGAHAVTSVLVLHRAWPDLALEGGSHGKGVRIGICVFSSAEITNSSSANGRPFQRRWYRSRTGPALAAKSGSRGKIQLRRLQGLKASSCNQRQIVTPLIDATIPALRT